MTELLDTPPVRDPARAVSARRWWILGVSVTIVLAVNAAVALFVSRYAFAQPLSNPGGGYSWAAPDNEHVTFARQGDSTVLVVPVRPGHVQSFYFNIRNDTPVAQTILGLAGGSSVTDARFTAEPESFAVATVTDDRLNQADFTYRPGPVTLPPHSDRFVRLSIHRMTCPGWTYQWFDSVSLRVRVGAFTRTETVRLTGTIFELSRPTTGC